MPRSDPGRPALTFVSHPKSGRTWMRYVLHLVGVRTHFTHAGAGSTSGSLGRRFEGVDPELLERERIVFMHRNPIDTAVSFYFQIHRKDLPPWSLRFFKRWLPYTWARRMPPRDIEDFVLHPGVGVPKIVAYNRAWIDALAERDDALVLSYEEARTSTHSVFRRLLGFAGRQVDDVERIVEQSSFENMRRLEASGRGRDLMLSEGRAGDPESRKVRRGRVRGYHDYLSPDVVARCREIAAAEGFAA